MLLFLALIQVVADLCDDAGLFDVSAHVAARVARGSRLRLFLLFTLLATVATWVLSIDTTAVLLAPIGLALAAELGLSALPFAFASIWLANAASLLLPVSNLTNLLAQEHLGLAAPGFVRETWLPQLAVLVGRARRAAGPAPAAPCAGRYDVPRDAAVARPGAARRLAAAVVLLIGPAIVAGVPAWLVALVGRRRAGRRVRRTPPRRPCARSAGPPGAVVGARLRDRAVRVVEVVVEEGSSVLGRDLRDRRLARRPAPAGRGQHGAGQRDQQPAGVPRRRAVRRLDAAAWSPRWSRVNVGPMLLAWGSLANLLWLRACRARGLEISMVRFGLEGLLVVPLAVAAGVARVVAHLGWCTCPPS